MKARNALILFLLMILVVMTGCGSPAAETKGIEITDQLGRKVIVPAKVERIVSSNYIDTTLLMALGARERIVGVEIKAETRPLYKYVAPEIMNLPGVGSGKTFNVEECLKLKPDLVVLPTRLKDYIGQLEQQNIAVIALAPENLQSMEEAINITAQAIGAQDKAKELKDFFNNKVEMVKKISAQSKESKPPVLYIAGTNPLTTSTKEMFQHTQVTLAGGINAAAEIEQGYWANVSLEQLLKWDPDEILMVQYAPYGPQEILKDSKWQGISAVKNNKVYRLPSKIEAWDMPTPSSVLGILWFTHHIYPGEYTENEFKADVTTFYEKFYGTKIPIEEFGL